MRTLSLLLVIASIFFFIGCEEMEPEPGPTPTPQTAAAFWAKTYGGTDSDVGYAIQETSDQGFLVFGYSHSFGDSKYDCYVLKLDTDGSLSWSKTFGGSDDDYAYAGIETSDSGFVMAGQIYSLGAGTYTDAWIVKRMDTGIISWQKRFQASETGHAAFNDVIKTGDNHYVVAGAYGTSTNVTNVLIMKFDEDGNTIWQKGFGGGGTDVVYSVCQTTDNGYILGGYTYSFGQGSYDGWIIKVNSIGNLDWHKVIGSTYGDSIKSIKQTTDLGFIMTGYYGATSADIHDVWVIKMDINGEFEWQYCYGGDGNEWGETIRQTPDGGYIVCGNTNSVGNGDYDVLVLKLSGAGAVEWQKTYGGIGYDRSLDIKITSDGGYILTGYTTTYGTGSNELWVLKLNESGECPPMDIDSSLPRYVPAPGIVSPPGVELAVTMSAADTTCTVSENPEVTVTTLIP